MTASTEQSHLKSIMLVIPSFEGKKQLQQLVQTLGISAAHLLVVDQGSADDTELFCRQEGLHCLQMGRQVSFMEASNAGIQWALKSDVCYVGICKPTIQLLTPVLSQLLEILSKEQSVGAIAPTKIVRNGADELVCRTQWDLSQLNLSNDKEILEDNALFLESDYCEFDFVLFPAAVFSQIGFLDEHFNKQYASADFCFRLWKQGYRILYHQKAQIFLETTSDGNSDLKASQEKFLKKHLLYGINYEKNAVSSVSSWGIINEFFYQYFKKYGLLDETRPRLKFSHPASVDPQYYPYLFTVWETTQLPKEWKTSLQNYEHIFLPSQWNYRVFQEAGCHKLTYVPLGFEPDIFNPWGDKFYFGCNKPFLTVCHNQYRKALDVTIQAWLAVKDKMPEAHLFLLGKIQDFIPFLGASHTRQWHQKIKYYRYETAQITILEPAETLTHQEIATLFRGAHTFVLNSRSEGFGFPIIEAMACETLTIVPNYGATVDFIHGRNCLALKGEPSRADYLDKGYEEVGSWWEPSQEHLKALLLEAYGMSNEERAQMLYDARQSVLTRFTWRHMAMKMYNALHDFQAPRGSSAVTHPVQKRPMTVWCAEQLIALGRCLVHVGDFMSTHGVLPVVRGVARSIRRKFFNR